MLALSQYHVKMYQKPSTTPPFEDFLEIYYYFLVCNEFTIKITKNPNKTTAINGKVTNPNSTNDGLAQSTANGAVEHGFIRSYPI
jgi:hypothetical protein